MRTQEKLKCYNFSFLQWLVKDVKPQYVMNSLSIAEKVYKQQYVKWTSSDKRCEQRAATRQWTFCRSNLRCQLTKLQWT